MSIGRRLYQARLASGMTQEQAAVKLCVSDRLYHIGRMIRQSRMLSWPKGSLIRMVFS